MFDWKGKKKQIYMNNAGINFYIFKTEVHIFFFSLFFFTLN